MPALKDLLPSDIIISVKGVIDREIGKICFDSRKVESGDVYVATRGFTVDGHDFIDSSIEKGASAVICEEYPESINEGVAYILVTNAREALGHAANAYYNYPSKQLKLIGVTGTNGKTTTATLAFNLAREMGLSTGLLSTVANKVNDDTIPSTHTTGDAIQICSLMAEMVAAGCSHCFMEVTSHAMDQHRTKGLEFDVAVFTNFTQDHLDYHLTMESYAAAKKKFFDGLSDGAVAILNSDDRKSDYMVQDTKAKVITYGSKGEPDFRIEQIATSPEGTKYQLNQNVVSSVLQGDFNAFNLSAAILSLSESNLDIKDAISAAKQINPVPGRLQTIPNRADIVGIVDFAHTPDALETILNTVRRSMPATSALICVVGCGGDRDKDKRPMMASIASRLAETVVFTSDNPRSEDALQIIEDMKSGVPSSENYIVEADRKCAIKMAVDGAKSGDYVVVAGKGHEKFQEIDGVKHPFDDADVLSRALKDK